MLPPTLDAHERCAPHARRILNDKMIGPDVPNPKAPTFKTAVILDALYHRALMQPVSTSTLNAAVLYEQLTGKEPGWLASGRD